MAAVVEVQMHENSSPSDTKEDANNNDNVSKSELIKVVSEDEGPAKNNSAMTTPTDGVDGVDGVTTTTSPQIDADVQSRRSSATASSVFSESQLAELQASFDECDKEKTGFISVSDLESVVGTLGLNIGPEAIREMIDRFDLKRSGEIDFDEFVEMMATTTRGGAPINEEEEIRQIFRVFDRNKTGFIDVDELRMVMKDLGENLSEEDLDAMMKEADVAGNGVISYDEFLLMFQSSNGKYKEKQQKNGNNTFCCSIL